MRFIYGLIVGLILVIGGAYIHDSMSEPSQALVNWTNVNEMERNTFDYLRVQFDRLINWATSSSK